MRIIEIIELLLLKSQFIRTIIIAQIYFFVCFAYLSKSLYFSINNAALAAKI